MIILCWAKSEKCLDPVPPPRLCTGHFEAGGAQMVFEAGGDVVYQGCSSLCLGGSSLYQRTEERTRVLCPGGFDFHVTIYFSAAPLWRRLSAPWQPAVLLLGGASLWRLHKLFASCRDVSSIPCPLQRRQNYLLKTTWKKRSLKAERMRLPKMERKLLTNISDFFLIPFTIPPPLSSLAFYLRINIVFIFSLLWGGFQSILNSKINTKWYWCSFLWNSCCLAGRTGDFVTEVL